MQNILIKGSEAKIADVGFARVLQKSYLSVLSGLGTLAWRCGGFIQKGWGVGVVQGCMELGWAQWAEGLTAVPQPTRMAAVSMIS